VKGFAEAKGLFRNEKKAANAGRILLQLIYLLQAASK